LPTFSATAEEQVTELLKRVKELTGMPDTANFHIIILYFKSFCIFQLQILPDDKAALEACHQDCMSSIDVAKQLDERDAGYKAEIIKLQSQIAEQLDEKEQRDGQLKKTQEMLVTSEAKASDTKAELQGLKEHATKWEVDIARLNADLTSKLSNPLIFILPDIIRPTYCQLLWHNNYVDIYSCF
jgi:DNA repair exonuclease SbcCD ATPase subunit